MKVVQLAARQLDKAGLFEIVEALRRDIESGKIIAFGGVGIAADDDTYSYTGCVKGQGVTRLKMVGAINTLLHCYHADHPDTDT